MTVSIQLKRGTKASLDLLASRNELKVAEPIFITDQDQLVVANSTSTYVATGGSGDISSLLQPDGATKIGTTPAGSLSATTVQASLAELDANKVQTNVLSAAGGAALVGFTPTGSVSATTVQDAIAELDLDLASKGSGTVTSVDVSVPTGLTVTGSPITSSGTIAIDLAAGYSIPSTASQNNWDSAYSQRLQWDGGSTNLIAATARASLGLGTLATKSTVALGDLPAGTTNGNVFMWDGTAWVIGGNLNTAISNIKNSAGTTIATGANNSLKIVGSGGTTVTGSGDTITISSTTGGGSGTVTSVAMTVPTGLSVSGSPITSSGTLAVSLASGYSIPTTASQSNWDAAYTDRNKWDGGSTGLNASTGRTSLGLGSLATQSSVTLAQLPAGTSTGNTFYWNGTAWVTGGNLDTAVTTIKNSAGTTIATATSNAIKIVGSGGTTVTGSGDTVTISSTTSSGTVTSVGVSVPTGLSVSNSPITTSGTIAIGLSAGYSIPTTTSQSNWDTAYTDRNKWDGGSTGLNAATARTSLGLGNLATQNAITLSQLPSGTSNGNLLVWYNSAWTIGGNAYSTVTNIATNSGTVSTSDNNITITGKNGISTSGSGSTLTISKSGVKIAIIGDSLSQNNIIRTNHWIDILRENIYKFNEDVSIVDLAIGGYTFYRANTELAFSYNSGTGQYTKTMVQECIDSAPDVVLVMLGMNDIAQSPSRTLAQMQSDASTLFNTLNTGLPNSKIVYVSEIFYDNINFNPSVANSVKNKGVIPIKFTLNSTGALANAYSSEILENVISSTTQTTLSNWKSLDSYIKGLTSYIDKSFNYYHWRVARLGLFLHDGIHQNDLGSRFIANNIFTELINAGIADAGFYNLYPTLVSKARAVLGTKTLNSATVVRGTVDPTGAENSYDWFYQVLSSSGDGYTTNYSNDDYRYLKDILGPFRRVDPDSWYMPTKGRYLINNKGSTSADSITLTFDNSSSCIISFFNTTPNTLVYKTLDNSTYSTTNVYTDSSGNCTIILRGIDFGATGSYTFRFKINNEVYGPISFTVNAAAVTSVTAGGTGSSTLTGAGIVTTTDTQTISGVKTFSNYSNSFTGVHYTSNGSNASNAFLSENSGYSLIGGSSGVVLAVGSVPGTASGGVVLDGSTTFRPFTDNSKTLGTSSYRWSTVYAVNGTINTSDLREKQNVVELSEVEKKIAKSIKSLVRRFEFKSNPSKLQIGVIAQEVIDVFSKEGLNALDYAIIDYQEWDSEFDEEGNEVVQAGNRYGVNYDQLLAFIISSI